MDRFTGKEGDPVGNSELDFVAQARRLMMFGNAGTQHGAFKIGGYQQLNGAGIAVRRGGFHHRSNRLLAVLRDPYLVLALAQLRRANLITAFQQIVIVESGWHHLVE